MKIEEMIIANRADCCGCEACANICPKNAVEMTRDAEGFSYPKINPDLCIKCGRCDKTCPSLNFTKKIPGKFPRTFVAIHPNEKVLRHSSSGGAFTALSEIIFKEGGIVFGASFDKNWHVYHRAARNFEELENLRGSKYVQSQIGDVYRQVREELKSKKVLFSGTPCQCAGLKNFLGGDHENLLTVEIICHGTPSPALWESYIDKISYAHEIAHLNFRSKRNGWGSNIDINFFDQGHIMVAISKHIYGKFFLSELISRPSCHSCKFKMPNEQSDLTIGDAWGVKDFAPKMMDKRGVSVVFIHTAKGNDFFYQTNLKMQQVKFIDAIKKNPQVISSTISDPRRKDFFAELVANQDWFAVMQKYHAQDDTEISKRTKKQNRLVFNKNFQSLLTDIRNNFEHNILVVMTPSTSSEQETFIKFFERNFPKCGIYFLTFSAERKFVCTETFTLIDFELKEDVMELSDLAKKFNFVRVLIENPLRWKSMTFIEWLRNCGLPMKTFYRKTN